MTGSGNAVAGDHEKKDEWEGIQGIRKMHSLYFSQSFT